VARSSSSTVLTMNLKLDAAPPNELVLIAKNQMKRTIIRRTSRQRQLDREVVLQNVSTCQEDSSTSFPNVRLLSASYMSSQSFRLSHEINTGRGCGLFLLVNIFLYPKYKRDDKDRERV